MRLSDLRFILSADDHEITRKGVRDVLMEAVPHVQIVEASDFSGMLASLDRHPWDLIILDVMMPGNGILDAVARTRRQLPSTPILILTGTNELTFVMETLKAGANGVVHKHRALDELMVAIREVISGGTYVDAESAAAIASDLRSSGQRLPHQTLSERELEVFRQIAIGKALKEIAAALDLSDKTVATYLNRIREKTGLQTHVDIARYALKNKVVE